MEDDATRQHIDVVQGLMKQVASDLVERSMKHDESKLEEPELSIFNEYGPKLKNTTYGSDEYKLYLNEMAEAIDHHYAHNRHHPEHWERGVDGMNLIDVVEMLCDWKASSLRHDDGDINKSLEINKDRFNISAQLLNILTNTVKELGW